jgi:stage III sporulation protein AG
MSHRSEQAIGEHFGVIWQRLGSNRLLLFGLIGVVALLALQLIWPAEKTNTPLSPSTLVEAQPSAAKTALGQIAEYRQELEQQLCQLLTEIKGVGEVNVMLALESGPEAVPAMNSQTSQKTTEEKDSSGGTRLTKEESQSNSLATSNSQLLLLQEKLPRVSGVVVVAQGAEHASIRLELARAVQTICNVPTHLVQVLPGK